MRVCTAEAFFNAVMKVLFIPLRKVLVQIALKHAVVQLSLFVRMASKALLEVLGGRNYIIRCLLGRLEHTAHRPVKCT